MNIIFEKGIPGFEYLKEFTLQEVEGDSRFKLIDSIEESKIGFVAISPFEVKEDYEIDLTQETIEELEITKPEEVMILNLITLEKTLETSTVNLKAPIIINISNNKARQQILQQDEYDIKHPLVRREEYANNY